MADLSLLFGYEGRAKIGEIELDVSISETHSLEAELTEHPVEEGSDISDHYRVIPTTFRIESMVTDSPIETAYPGKTFVNSINSLEKDSTPSQDAWETLNSYVADSKIINIITSLQTYENVVILSVKVDRDADTGRCLRFECIAKRLRIVKTETVTRVVPKTTTLQTEKKKGKKPKKKPTPEKRTSMAAKLLDLL